MVRVVLIDEPDCFRATQDRVAEKKRGKRISTVSRRCPAGYAGALIAEIRAAGDILLAESVRVLVMERVAEFHRVRSAYVAKIVLHRPTGLFRPVVRSAVPPRVLRHRDVRKIHIAVDGAFHADFVFPVAAGCAGEAVFAERVLEPREVVDHARADGVVVRNTEGFGIPSLDLSVPKRYRQSRRSCRTWLVAKCRHVPKEAQTLLVTNHLIAFGAPLVRRGDECSTGHDVIISNVGAGARHASQVRCHTLAIGNYSSAQLRKPVSWDLVVREDVADEAGAVRIRPALWRGHRSESVDHSGPPSLRSRLCTSREWAR